MNNFILAIDVGASSGRHIVGEEKNGCFLLHETYRFHNSVIKKDNDLIWDIDEIVKQVIIGIKKSLEQYPEISSLAIDTWGVDYVLLHNEKVIYPVYAYRSDRTKEAIKAVHAIIPFEKLYALTGCQFQPFNTIYQFMADKLNHRLDNATDYLMIPEYLTFVLTGKKVHEYTNASTMGLLDINTNAFSEEIIDKLGLKKSLFKRCSYPGIVVGKLTPEIAKKVGKTLEVRLCASHDTASAVEAIKMEENAPYLSSGTWSLLGLKLSKGISNKKAQKSNFSNEYGPDYIRFQKNITGMWIIQNIVKDTNLSFLEIMEQAQQSNYHEIFDVNDPCFVASTNMVDEIKNWFIAHKKKPPITVADCASSTYHSLAYSYDVAIKELSRITGETFKELYIVGGGAKNEFLNDLTKKYTKLKINALPIEATALGNIYSQRR